MASNHVLLLETRCRIAFTEGLHHRKLNVTCQCVNAWQKQTIIKMFEILCIYILHLWSC